MGREVSPDRFAEEFSKAAMRKVQEGITRKVQSAICPVHHQRATITPTTKDKYEIHGCCQDLIERVKRDLEASEN